MLKPCGTLLSLVCLEAWHPEPDVSMLGTLHQAYRGDIKLVMQKIWHVVRESHRSCDTEDGITNTEVVGVPSPKIWESRPEANEMFGVFGRVCWARPVPTKEKKKPHKQKKNRKLTEKEITATSMSICESCPEDGIRRCTLAKRKRKKRHKAAHGNHCRGWRGRRLFEA